MSSEGGRRRGSLTHDAKVKDLSFIKPQPYFPFMQTALHPIQPNLSLRLRLLLRGVLLLLVVEDRRMDGVLR